MTMMKIQLRSMVEAYFSKENCKEDKECDILEENTDGIKGNMIDGSV